VSTGFEYYFRIRIFEYSITAAVTRVNNNILAKLYRLTLYSQ